MVLEIPDRREKDHPLAQGAQGLDGGGHDQGRNTDPDGITRAEALKRVLRDVAACDRIGSAWRLFLTLLLDGGSICGSYRQIAERLGANERSVRNWIRAIEDAGVAKRVNHGKGIEIRLAEPYLGYSHLPDRTHAAGAELVNDSPRAHFLKTVQAGAEAVGAKVELRISM